MSTRTIGGDIIAKMRKTKPKDGDNTLHSFTADGKRYRMVAVVRHGEIRNFAAVDASGTRHQTELLRVAAGAKTTCWRCFVDGKGNRHCVEIPCPTGPMTPWPGFNMP